MMQTPAAMLYTDPAHLRVEQNEIFARSWQLAGHTGQREGDASPPVIRFMTFA